MSATGNVNYHHPQPWRTFSTPLTIPRPQHHYNPYSTDPKHQYPYQYQYQYHHHRYQTPPSLSPSPAPSSSADTTASREVITIEIEELAPADADADVDSGVELLTGEYEEAPEGYRCAGYGAADDEDEDGDGDALAASHRSIVYGFERLTARTKRGKRSYAESVGSSSCASGSSWGDSGVESEGEAAAAGEEEARGRRVRRKVQEKVQDVGACGYGYGYGWDDNEIDMEL